MSANTAVMEELHQAIVEQRNMEELEGLLWAGVLAYQNQTFYTLSGLEFSYTVKHKKNGDYSGELLISRKETSKTLTRKLRDAGIPQSPRRDEIQRNQWSSISSSSGIPADQNQSGRSLESHISSACFQEFGLIRTNEKKK